jgi:ureidoacrylate peracid hydrolase
MVHPVGIPQDIRDRIGRRRGRFEIFDRLEPAKTALVVIDMQKAFVDPGAPIEVPLARAIIPNINRLADMLRKAGGIVAWVTTALTDDEGAHPWTVFYEHFTTPKFARAHLAAMTEGSELHGLAAGLDVRGGDLKVSKDRFSCFIQGSSPLDGILRENGIDTVIIAGTLTNRCCESSARDAMMIGYKVVFVEDANAAVTDDEHVWALINVASGFGDVRRTDDVVAMLDG